MGFLNLEIKTTNHSCFNKRNFTSHEAKPCKTTIYWLFIWKSANEIINFILDKAYKKWYKSKNLVWL